MNQSAWIANDPNVQFATAQQKRYRAELLRAASRICEDSDRKNRLEKCECPICYYLNSRRIGGSRVTHRACGDCGNQMTFGNTCTDVLCVTCAKARGLCRRCGADLELKFHRKGWFATDPGPQRGPASVAQIESQEKRDKKDLEVVDGG